MMLNLQSYPTTVLNERMWHSWEGVKTYSDPSYIFSGVKTPDPHDLRPWMILGMGGKRECLRRNGRLGTVRNSYTPLVSFPVQNWILTQLQLLTPCPSVFWRDMWFAIVCTNIQPPPPSPFRPQYWLGKPHCDSSVFVPKPESGRLTFLMCYVNLYNNIVVGRHHYAAGTTWLLLKYIFVTRYFRKVAKVAKFTK